MTETVRRAWCEWKGQAGYYSLSVGDRQVKSTAWFYPNPAPGYEAIQGHVAFYPGKMDACYVGGEQVRAQPGDFYGGWITGDIAGPFRGGLVVAGTIGGHPHLGGQQTTLADRCRPLNPFLDERQHRP